MRLIISLPSGMGFLYKILKAALKSQSLFKFLQFTSDNFIHKMNHEGIFTPREEYGGHIFPVNRFFGIVGICLRKIFLFLKYADP
jgi:hypothetical protein